MKLSPRKTSNQLSWFILMLVCGFVGGTHGYGAPHLSANQLPSSDSNLLSRWVSELQYVNPNLSSYGALKIHHDSAATSEDGTRYYRVSPYNANLGVLGLLRSGTPQSLPIATRWIDWYLAHLNEQSAPDGVPYEHFYRADGTGETTCVKPGDRALCRYNDATDSAVATFFSVLRAAYEAGVPATFFNTPERRQKIEKLAAVLLDLQQADGLCWAKLDYRAKYLEDNCEVFAGLRDLAALEQSLFLNQQRSQFFASAAERVRAGILRELYDAETGLYHIAKFEDGKLHKANLAVWYADSQAQMWPHLWGVVAPEDARSKAVVKALNTHWKGKNHLDWATTPGAASNGWIEAGVAYAMLLSGERAHVQTYLQVVKRLKFSDLPEQKNFTWPFSIADAGWLLTVLKDESEAGGGKQEAGGRRQEAGGRRQEAG